MKRALAYLGAGVVMAAMATAAQAGTQTRLLVTFEGFPPGMTCDVKDAFVPVRHSVKRGNPRIMLTSYASVGEIFCVLPGGQRIVSNVNQRLRAKARAVGVRVYADGKAIMTTSVVGGIIRDDLSKTLEAG